MTYILLGIRKSDKVEVYWTGKAGDSFASESRADAFDCSYVLADRRKSQFNEWNGPVFWTNILPKDIENIKV
jgi:hypothetical protein